MPVFLSGFCMSEGIESRKESKVSINMRKAVDFTEGKILGPLMKFTGPILLAMFLQSMYGAVDLLIVGRFASTVDVSAVATGSQMMQSITGAITGLAMGITILLGQYIGEKKLDQAGKAIGSGIVLFAMIAIAATIIFAGFSGFFASALKAPEEAYESTVHYLQICALGIIFIIAFNAMGSIFRGIGDSKMPLLTVSIACIFNILGDLLLVAAFHMGASGAALATIAAQAISVLLSFIIISKKELPINFSKSYIRPDMFYMGKNIEIWCSGCITGYFGESVFFGHHGDHQPIGIDEIGRRRGCREGMRLYYACTISLYAGIVRLCCTECRRRKNRARKKGTVLFHWNFHSSRNSHVFCLFLPGRDAGIHIFK